MFAFWTAGKNVAAAHQFAFRTEIVFLPMCLFLSCTAAATFISLSRLFLSGSLDKLSKSYNLDLGKTYFPYTWNKESNFNSISPGMHQFN